MNRNPTAKLLDRPRPSVRTGLIVFMLTIATAALPAIARTPYRGASGPAARPHVYLQPTNQAAEHAHSRGAHGTTAGMRAAQQRLRGNKEAGLTRPPAPGPGPLAEHQHWPDSHAAQGAAAR